MDFNKLMSDILFHGLKDILDNHLIIFISVALEPGLIVPPGDNAKVDLDTLVHVNFNVVLSGINIVHDAEHFDLVVLEAVLDDVDLLDFFHVEELFDQVMGSCLLVGEVELVRVLSIKFCALEFRVTDLDTFGQSLTYHCLGDLELFLHAIVAQEHDAF